MTRANPDNILLSICIPTHNRANYLDELLKSIIQQTQAFNYEVRVRDNASTDDTYEVFNKYAKGENNWHYHRNLKNIGGRANIRSCTEGAQGTWVFIIGDDDKLVSNAFVILSELLKVDKVAAILANQSFDRHLGHFKKLGNGFEWLRYASINVPAFISNVVWRRSFWEEYPYFDYPAEMSLPQLDCFIDACIAEDVVVCGRSLVEVGHAENAANIGYWFFKRHALVDCYEYPKLYDKVIRSKKINLTTYLMIKLRKIMLLRHIFKKMLFMRYNEIYYRPSVDKFRQYHGCEIYWPFMFLCYLFIFNTYLGKLMSHSFYSQYEKFKLSNFSDNQF